ncbi:hypothetical protein [Listeria marthii]|uniref:hypothetical protein n=1 Tax=Listeria marthii TaxID=529731 RepID=UPI00188802EE|nr:hypothetical protein [Listeria marthii]MBF2490264.1 hypothetical protein [Listeria marthii]
MLLKKINSENINIKSEVHMEKVVDDLLMISVKMDTKNNKSYYDYWRLTRTMGIPPLEIGIDKTDGSIQTIVFFVASDFFKKMDFSLTKENEGLIMVDSSIFKKENDYVDIDSNYFIFLDSDELVCSFEEDFEPDSSYNINRIRVFLKLNEVIGFSIKDLTSIEIEELKSL